MMINTGAAFAVVFFGLPDILSAHGDNSTMFFYGNSIIRY